MCKSFARIINWKEGFMKLTPIRKEILRIVKDSNKPISTKLIKEKFGLEADISNIYRNLNALELDRSINSISIEGIKYYYAFESQNGHFIICKNCGEIQTFYNCHEHKLKEELEKGISYYDIMIQNIENLKLGLEYNENNNGN